MARKILLGHKVRRLRQDHGLSQIGMAERLGISPSYLNLIEHNQRPLTLPLVLKISHLFEVDLQTFSVEEEVRLAANLEEVFGDSLFRGHQPDSEDLRDLVVSHPEISQAMIALYQAYRHAGDTVHVLRESLSGETFLSTSSHQLLTLLTSIRSFSEILLDYGDLDSRERERFLGIISQESERLANVVAEMLEYGQGEALKGVLGASSPAEEVVNFFERHGNYFPDLEAAAVDLRRAAGLSPGEQADGLAAFLKKRFSIRVERARALALGADLARYDESEQRLLLSEILAPASVRFEIAHLLGRLSARPVIDAYIDEADLAGSDARVLGRDVLANYFAAAVIMPYDEVLQAARQLRHDIELLQHRFGASYEQVCHRLTTLRRPGATGIPFHFVRVDIAGNIAKRFSGAGMRIPRFGGACPRWNVHAAFLSPGVIHAQAEQLPDDTIYLSIACSLMKAGGGHNTPKSHFSIGIGCELSYASQIVYADGLDLDQTTAAVPIGITCRLCERADCAQRAFPALVREGGAIPERVRALESAAS